MLEIVYEHKFEKDLRIAKKRGLNLQKLEIIISLLSMEKPLPEKNYVHKLKGNLRDYWECHITPNWILIYQKTKTTLILARTGSHSDLF